MKREEAVEKLVMIGRDERRLVLVAGILCIAAFSMFQFRGYVQEILKKVHGTYAEDLELSRHKEKYKEAYGKIVSTNRLPAQKDLGQNPWIQKTQALFQECQLSLRELSPVTQKGKFGKKKVQLSLVVDGEVPNVMRFLYRLSESQDWVYVEKLNMAVDAAHTDTVRVQATLAQD